MKRQTYPIAILLCLSISSLHTKPATWIKDLQSFYKQTPVLQHEKPPKTPQATAPAAISISSITKSTNKLSSDWTSWSTKFLQKTLNKSNPYKNQQAQVVTGQKLPQDEINYIAHRTKNAQKILQTFLGNSIKPDQMPTIALACSGGGYRARIASLGYALGLESIGIFDALLYISTLSGSTWFLGPWISSEESLDQYKQTLLEQINKKNFSLDSFTNLENFDFETFFSDVIWPKFIFGQPITLIDFYSAFLSHAFFNEFSVDTKKSLYYLNNEWDSIKKTNKPFPIYTTVMPKTDGSKVNYHWFEFNPLQMRSVEDGLAIPSWSFDSPFDKGASKHIWLRQNFGFYLGTCSSAFEVSFKDLYRLYYKKASSGSSDPLKEIEYQGIKALLNVLINIDEVGTFRMAPTSIFNPFKKMSLSNQWLSKQDYLYFVDAGIHYNYPVRSLFIKERNIDIVIIGDGSANLIGQPGDLPQMFDDLKKAYGYTYERVDKKSTDTFKLFIDKNHTSAPGIIYVNFVNDPVILKKAQSDSALKKIITNNKLTTFNAAEQLNKTLSTFNFDYSQTVFNQLSGMAMFNLVAHKDEIKGFIKTISKLK